MRDVNTLRGGPARPVRAFPSEGTEVPEGGAREFMIVPQTMFNVLARHFEGIVPDEADGNHGGVSADNVRWLQRAAGLPPTGCLDAAAWDALSHLYEIFVVWEDCRPEFSGGWG